MRIKKHQRNVRLKHAIQSALAALRHQILFDKIIVIYITIIATYIDIIFPEKVQRTPRNTETSRQFE